MQRDSAQSSSGLDLSTGILGLTVEASPHLQRPEHFAAYAAELEQGVGGGKRVVFAAPPQHGKTQVTLHGLVWLILKYPEKRHAYITYSQERARSVARNVKRILEALGVVVSGTLDMMTFPGLSGLAQCKFTSIDGGITGEPVDGVAIIDDPFKNRKEADSPTRRNVVKESYEEAIETRVHPGASVFVLATRWHPEDLSGFLIDAGWMNINLPALAEEDDPNGRQPGEALFPDMWSAEALDEKRKRVGEFTWAALYQGRPRPRGGTVFHEPTYYSELPKYGVSVAFGVDLAYTAKTVSDVSICLELWKEKRQDNLEPLYYIRQVDRGQVEAPDFAGVLSMRAKQKPGAKFLWRGSGTEKGSAQFIRKQGVPLTLTQPPGDKFVSSQEAAALWNQGLIMVPDPEQFPEASSWLDVFLGVVLNFTGNDKERDDDVDALGNAVAAFGNESIKGAYRRLKQRARG